MKTYYCHHEGEEFFNCDLFVIAENPDQAYDHWLKYCHVNAWQLETGATVWIYDLSLLNSSVGAVDWSNINKFTFST